MIKVIVAIITTIAGCLLLGIIANHIPKSHHLKIRITMCTIGIATIVISLLQRFDYVFIGVGLIVGGFLFMPSKKQADLLMDILSLGN